MTGREIFEKYTKNCTPATTPTKKYGQLLDTICSNLFLHGQEEEFFTLLEKAEKEDKKLAINIPDDIMYDDFNISAIILA